MKYEQMIKQTRNSMSASRWLKQAVEDLERRDPVDVLRDLGELQAIYDAKCDELFGVCDVSDESVYA